MNLFELFKNGGFIMYPLMVCSILVLAVAMERCWFFSHFQKQSAQLFEKAGKLLLENKVNETKGLAQATHPLVSNPLLVMLETKDQFSRDIWEQKIARKLLETQAGLKKFLWVLGTIGSSAPFIGLFGTVVGIIRSFEAMAQTGKSGFSVVAAGLSEALIATAAGIVVAVFAVVLYNYFQTKLNGINLVFKNGVEEIADLLKK
jgi:biopolymer transport protein ExbB/TolQ